MLPEQAQKQLAAYERGKFKDMHQALLDDDGIPRLCDRLREIRFDMSRLKNYQGIRTERPPAPGNAEADKQGVGASRAAKAGKTASGSELRPKREPDAGTSTGKTRSRERRFTELPGLSRGRGVGPGGPQERLRAGQRLTAEGRAAAIKA